MPLERRHLQTYQELFCHRGDLYALQRANGAYFLKSAPLTPEVIRVHLLGGLTVGFYALTPDNTTRWVVLDADREDGLEQLQWSAQDAEGHHELVGDLGPGLARSTASITRIRRFWNRLSGPQYARGVNFQAERCRHIHLIILAIR